VGRQGELEPLPAGVGVADSRLLPSCGLLCCSLERPCSRWWCTRISSWG